MGTLPSPCCRGRPLAALLAALALGACALGGDPVQRLEHYPGALATPLGERIRPADPAVVERTHRTNLELGMKVRPRAARPDHPLLPVVREVVATLPTAVRRLAEGHLVALYLLEEDFGTAVTEGVRSPELGWRYAYIALNLTALERDANAWGTWKERSAFRPASGYRLRMVLEEGPADDRAGAIRFILLHELGHVLGLGLGVHGYWEGAEEMRGQAALSAYPYVARSWRSDGGGTLVSRWAERFPRLHEAGFYRFDEAPFRLDEAERRYRELAGTDLPSLYGTTNPYDDFAEAFAIYVHTRLLGKPYRVEVGPEGAPGFTYRSCIQTGGCPGKVARLEALLGTP